MENIQEEINKIENKINNTSKRLTNNHRQSIL